MHIFGCPTLLFTASGERLLTEKVQSLHLTLDRVLYARKQKVPGFLSCSNERNIFFAVYILRCLSVLSVLISVCFFPPILLSNAFSCLLMVWAASLMNVSSSFPMQLPLQLIYLLIFVFSSALNGLWKVEKKIQSAFGGHWTAE